jgi:hypothetical protein
MVGGGRGGGRDDDDDDDDGRDSAEARHERDRVVNLKLRDRRAHGPRIAERPAARAWDTCCTRGGWVDGREDGSIQLPKSTYRLRMRLRVFHERAPPDRPPPPPPPPPSSSSFILLLHPPPSSSSFYPPQNRQPPLPAPGEEKSRAGA